MCTLDAHNIAILFITIIKEQLSQVQGQGQDATSLTSAGPGMDIFINIIAIYHCDIKPKMQNKVIVWDWQLILSTLLVAHRLWEAYQSVSSRRRQSQPQPFCCFSARSDMATEPYGAMGRSYGHMQLRLFPCPWGDLRNPRRKTFKSNLLGIWNDKLKCKNNLRASSKFVLVQDVN